MSEFDQIKKVSQKHGYVKTEPGITLRRLNQELKGKDMEVPLAYPTWLAGDVPIDQAVQQDTLCLRSYKDGFFNESQRVRRLGLVSGAGNLL